MKIISYSKKSKEKTNTNDDNNNVAIVGTSSNIITSSGDECAINQNASTSKMDNEALLITANPQKPLQNINRIDGYDARYLIRDVLGFTSLDLLGQGGFGVVYSVHCSPKFLSQPSPKPIDEDGNVEIACKLFYLGKNFDVFTKSRWYSFVDEVKNLRRIPSHERIVSYYGNFALFCNGDATDEEYTLELEQNCTTGERKPPNRSILLAGVCMEKLSMSLHSWMYQYDIEYLECDQLVQLFLQIGDALSYLHKHHYTCHEDIKPHNIALCVDRGANELGPLKLIDFGVAATYTADTYAEAEFLATLQSIDDGHSYLNDAQSTGATSSWTDSLDEGFNPFLGEASDFANEIIRLAIQDDNQFDLGTMDVNLFKFEHDSLYDYSQIKHLALKRVLIRCTTMHNHTRVTVEWALNEYARLCEEN